MKRIMLVCLTALAVSGTYPLYAQSSGSDFMAGDKSLFEEVTGIKKKTDKFNLYLNMHGDFNMKWNDSGFDQGAFEMKQLRIEMKGDINDWLSYRYRQRLNRGNDGSGNIDNVPTSIDWAGVGIKLNKFSFFAGKQCVSYGGIEFDLNPIDIYEYSDMIEHMSNFMTGLNVAYNYNPYQQIQFQVLNSRERTVRGDVWGFGTYQTAVSLYLELERKFPGCFQNPLVCLCYERNEGRKDVLLRFG